MRRLLLVIALGLVAVSSASAGTGAARKLSPAETVRAYVAAIVAKDGPKLCSLLHPLEAKAVGAQLAAAFSSPKNVIKPIPCPRIVGAIGSGGARDNSPRWTRTKIVHMEAPQVHEGGMINIDVEMRDTWGKPPPSKETRWTRFWLASYHGRYVILRHSSTLDQAMWSEQGDGADAPPATREPRAEDVKIPATAACGTPTWTVTDPKGDGRAAGVPALDLRRISVTDGPNVCVSLKFEAPLLPGSEIDLTVGGGSGGPTLYILADGTVSYYGYDDDVALPGTDFGLADDRTLVLRFKHDPARPLGPKSVDVIVDNLSISEPLIDTQPKLGGGDYYSGWDT